MTRWNCGCSAAKATVGVLDKDFAGEGARGFRPTIIDRAAGLPVEVDAGTGLRPPRQYRRPGLQLVLLGVPRPHKYGHMAAGGAGPAIDVARRWRDVGQDRSGQGAGLGEDRADGVELGGKCASRERVFGVHTLARRPKTFYSRLFWGFRQCKFPADQGGTAAAVSITTWAYNCPQAGHWTAAPGCSAKTLAQAQHR